MDWFFDYREGLDVVIRLAVIASLPVSVPTKIKRKIAQDIRANLSDRKLTESTGYFYRCSAVQCSSHSVPPKNKQQIGVQAVERNLTNSYVLSIFCLDP